MPSATDAAGPSKQPAASKLDDADRPLSATSRPTPLSVMNNGRQRPASTTPASTGRRADSMVEVLATIEQLQQQSEQRLHDYERLKTELLVAQLERDSLKAEHAALRNTTKVKRG